jgi:hypothetical protein
MCIIKAAAPAEIYIEQKKTAAPDDAAVVIA